MSADETEVGASADQGEASVENEVSSGPWLKTLGTGLGGWVSNVGGYATSFSDKLKTAVQSNSLLSEFEEEQKKFVREQQRVKDTAVPPWVGYNEEEQIKAQILELSADSRTVLRQPPPGVQFLFDFKKSFPVAQAILKEDKRLQKMRFELVPKKISEEKFWHNYFYRVFLVKQSSQLATLASSEHKVVAQDDTDKPDQGTPMAPLSTVEPATPVDDFASDALTSSADSETIDRDSVANELEQLGVVTGVSVPADEWDDELARELEDLGLGDREGGANETDQHWEDEIERMLEMHSDS